MKIFGLTFNNKKNVEDKKVESFVPPSNDDGSLIAASNFYGLALDIDGIIRDENDLIRRYREAADYPDCSSAIDDICNEVITIDDTKPPVSVNLDAVKYSDSIKNKIKAEFDKVLQLYDFNNKSYDMFRQFYIDGKQYFHVIPDPKNPKNGIVEVRNIDPRKIKKIKEVVTNKDVNGVDVTTTTDEYYLYNDKGFNNDTKSGVRLSLDSIIYISSGLIDPNTGLVKSYLHKCIKIVNQLKMTEDSLVIYRFTRAPERRVFYIDVGDLPKIKADQYVQDTMARFRNKLVYNSSTGEIADDRKSLSMLEDYWMPRRTGGRSTEIETLPGGCFSMDTKVSLLDGRDLSIREIEHELNNGKELWTYSCDQYTGEIKPGLISWAGVTHKSAKVMKLTLDNGETIICTPDHKFPIYNKGFVEAKDFVVGESLIPLYRKREVISKHRKHDYEKVFDNASKKWIYTHRLIRKHIDLPLEIYQEDFGDGYVVHHKDVNRFNNSPENLCLMSFKDHQLYHNSIGFPPMMGTIAMSAKVKRERELNSEWYRNFVNKQRESLRTYYNNLSEEELADFCKKVSIGLRNYYDNRTPEQIERDVAKNRINFAKANSALHHKLKTDDEFHKFFCDQLKQSWDDERRNNASERMKVENIRRHSNLEWHDKFVKNHRKIQMLEFDNFILRCIIDSITGTTSSQVSAAKLAEILNNNEDCLNRFIELNGDKHVPNFNVNNGFTERSISKCLNQFGYKNLNHLRKNIDTHNHRVVAIEYLDDEIEVGTLTIDGYEIYHNHHTFALSCGVFTKNSGMSNIEDITYFQNKLYRSLNVPISRLIPEQGFSIGRSQETSRDEIKFSKFVTRLRSKFSQLLLQLLRIQLISKGIVSIQDWEDISNKILITYLQDNHFAELKDNDILQGRLSTLQIIDSYVGKYYSVEWVRKNVLKQSDEEMKLIDDQNKQNPPESEDQDSEDDTQTDNTESIL